ncbi:isochorismate synthase [Tahibacter amnicola]|uniref:isochorismate synthase n=1 Tax=Tahibacter amnicola TaxID=2976241 RepID=A0ABY6B9S9_9GAMM|nr:isochorismate synthase [Tahibacter amnicola]UXI66614.1 isochorismate synthase [Tahibacter amnicola]
MNNPGLSLARENAASELVSHCRHGTSFFASPTRTLLAQGADATLHAVADGDLSARAATLLSAVRRDGWTSPLLIGAVPFRHDGRAHLMVPSRLNVAAAMTAAPDRHTSATPSARARPEVIRMAPTPDGYRGIVADAVAHIRARRMEKVVLSRSVTLDADIDVQSLVARLAQRNPTGYTYSIDLSGRAGEQRTLVGASPELLLAKNGASVYSNPLAGSVPRSSDPIEDQRRAQGLLRSAKDLHEHAVVADAVAERLRPYCRHLEVPLTPSVVATPTMWHLSSEIRGQLRDAHIPSLHLAMALHPTPAVCGNPPDSARAFIDEAEGFDRDLFTGLVGWCNAEGDGEWAVTIRCATVRQGEVTLYAGAGIVAGSDPALELAETTAKLRTMLGAMQLDAVLDGAA